MKKTTKEWVKKAEQDYLLAKSVQTSSNSFHDGVCFHCQQSAEKYLKGVMEEAGLQVPKIHNLKLLIAALLPQYQQVRNLQRGAVYLTRFAVTTRYPGEDATKRQAVAALRWAGRVRQSARTLLGLKDDATKE